MRQLVLFLRSPWQSWGTTAKFGDRPTQSFPSKSGIIGMLAAACGVSRDDEAWLKKVSKISMTCYVFAAGKLQRDYHTVGGGYDEAHIWERRHISPKASGNALSTVLTNREYLADAAFGVVLTGEDDALIMELAKAIQNPIWGIWLGRKSCIPTEPVYVGVFQGENETLAALKGRVMRLPNMVEEKLECVKVLSEADNATLDDVWHDIPVNFEKRLFGARMVCRDCWNDIV